MRYILISLCALVLSNQVFAHGSNSAMGSPGDPNAVSLVIHINADDIKFVPKAVTVKVGQTVRFVVTNHGVLPHEFVIGDPAEQEEHEKEMQAMGAMEHKEPNAIAVKPGQTGSLVWRFVTMGTTEYACHVPGHYAAGMVGTIEVREHP